MPSDTHPRRGGDVSDYCASCGHPLIDLPCPRPTCRKSPSCSVLVVAKPGRPDTKYERQPLGKGLWIWSLTR